MSKGRVSILEVSLLFKTGRQDTAFTLVPNNMKVLMISRMDSMNQMERDHFYLCFLESAVRMANVAFIKVPPSPA